MGDIKHSTEIVGEGIEDTMSKVFWNKPDGGGNVSRLAGLTLKMDPKKWPNFHIPPVLRNRGN